MVNNLADLAVTTFLAEQIKNVRIAVIGDVMLDRYFQGEVKRISPEAPVPVKRITKINSVLGGAANVAANLAHLECQVFMGGVTGDDENRLLLEKLMDDAGINHHGLVKSKRRKTITKLRVLGGNQQMLRLDFEETGDLFPDEIVELRHWLAGLLDEGLDGIIVSDYAKGVCSDDFCQWVIAQGKAYDIPVLIDPKGADWSKYDGCDFITPNLKEMCEAAGCQRENSDEAVVSMAQAAREKFHIKNVVVTRSERGMSLVNAEQVLHSPATAIEVFDVSGAGDTVAATLLAGVAGKLALADLSSTFPLINSILVILFIFAFSFASIIASLTSSIPMTLLTLSLKYIPIDPVPQYKSSIFSFLSTNDFIYLNISFAI